ncbi:MAG: putative glycoside hydrolase [Actinomycetota bacterium]|nr:putative glycoside hydrolase [Actinomycetota bacterium]
MLFEQMEPNERFRARREDARRRRRRRRAVVVGLLLAVTACLAAGARFVVGGESAKTVASAPQPAAKQPVKKQAPVKQPRALPDEVRGIHVTMALASLDGKLEEYLELVDEGMNTMQLDIKDENGEIGFVPSAVPLATEVGAAKSYYRPRETARLIHKKGVYLIGRVVTFEDPVLSTGRPELAIKTPDGSVWRNHAGLGWTNPYDRRVWDYNVSIAEVAARAGFDEIQFDYVRFPSDGDIDSIVYPNKTSTAPGWVIAQFVHYAKARLKPLGVRVSADVFGLAATRDLGIGQIPRRLSKYVDALYPMVYPSHYGSGEYGLEDPNASPGPTVEWSLADFRRELKQSKAQLIPWLQDFSYGRTYGAADVRAQIDAARLMGARGYLLWNPLGIYTPGALAPA